MNIALRTIFFLAAFFLLYHEALRHTLSSWVSEDGSYGWIIAAAALYLLWLKKDQIRGLPVHPAILPGALLTAAGCLMLFLGKISGTILIQKVSMIPVLLGGIWMLGGFALFKAFLLPVGYLIFLTGFMEAMLSGIGTLLQLASARIAYQVLSAVGIPVLLDGTIIHLQYITLQVVRACSGISQIVALMALAVPLAYFTQRTLVRRSALVLAVLPIGVLINGLRIAFIGFYARYLEEGQNVHGPYEMLYTSSIFFIGLALLFLISWVFGNWKAFESKKSQDVPPITQNTGQTRPGNNRAAASAVLAGIIVLTLWAVYFHQPAPVPLNGALQAFPVEIGPLTGRDMTWMDDQLVPFAADEELIRSYADDSGARLNLYIGYFEYQDREKKIVDYRRAWMYHEAAPLALHADNAIHVVNKTRLRRGFHASDVYFWYLIDGRIITSEYMGKLATFWKGLARRKTNAAIVIVETQDPPEQVIPLIQKILPAVMEHLPNV